MSDETAKDGGQAFPSVSEHAFDGMSLRDYFAAMALQGVLANREVNIPDPDQVDECEQLGQCAYWIADAMLKARGGSR